MTFDEFCTRFIRKFDSADVLTQLQAALYDQSQAASETAEAFILKKRAMFERLAGTGHEDEIIRLTLTQLRPELRSKSRTMNYRYVEDFMEVASQLEQDLLEEQKLHKPVAAPKPPFLEPPRQTPAPKKPQAQWRNREGDYRPPERTQTWGNV